MKGFFFSSLNIGAYVLRGVTSSKLERSPSILDGDGWSCHWLVPLWLTKTIIMSISGYICWTMAFPCLKYRLSRLIRRHQEDPGCEAAVCRLLVIMVVSQLNGMVRSQNVTMETKMQSCRNTNERLFKAIQASRGNVVAITIQICACEISWDPRNDITGFLRDVLSHIQGIITMIRVLYKMKIISRMDTLTFLQDIWYVSWLRFYF